MQIKKYIYFFLLLSSVISSVFAQETGIPSIQNYSPNEYKQHEQNWSIIQDNRGIMYFGNSHGLLEYDGVSWRYIKTTNPDIVRSLAVDDSNTIYIGGYNYFGLLETNSAKNYVFNSLSEKLDSKFKKFNNVWDINISKENIYFQTDSALFKWSKNKFDVWETSSPGNRSFMIRDTLYIINNEIGLGYIEDNIFVKIDGAEFFTKNKIYAMESLDENKSIIGTRSLGLFILSKNSIQPFITEVDDYIIKNKITDIVVLDNNNIVISTREKGLVIINKSGELTQIIDKEKGLGDNTIWKMYADDQYGLWLALNNGIARVELPSPITYYNEKSGIEGNVESLANYKNSLYISTALGLYFIDQNSEKVQKIKGFRPYKIISTGRSLICSGYESGLYEISNNEIKIINNYTPYSFYQSKIDSNRIYLGLEDAIGSIYFKNNIWLDEGHLHLVSSPIRDIKETDTDELWLRTSGPALIKITLAKDKSNWEDVQVKYLGIENGLIHSAQNYIFKFNNQIIIGNKNRLLSFDETSNKFIPDKKLNQIFSDTIYSIYGMYPDNRSNYWLLLSSDNGYSVGKIISLEEDNYEFQLDRFIQLSGRYYYSVQSDKNNENITWFGGPDGIIRFDSQIEKDYKIKYPCLIRRVLTKNDSIIFTGNDSEINNKLNAITLEYVNNSLKVEFAAPFYEYENSILYQNYLEGFDKNWSNWSNEPKAIYTNIPEGRYVFRVRAKNIYNMVSNEARYAFIILPPWYRSLWAYIIYGIMVVGIVFGLIKLRSYKLEAEKKQLEKIIYERTDEIQLKNKQLEEQAEKLQEMDEVKSRFFANISHELRTPLTLIKGPTEELVNQTYPGNQTVALNSILINTNRMLRLINELLDLSKLESGSVKLNVSKYNIHEFFNYIVDSFKSIAESKNIHFHYERSNEEFEVYFDRKKMEKIVFNLLSNAFKFTPDSGYITIAVKKISHIAFSQGAIEISIHDSGLGIPENEIDQIFDRFTQAENAANTRIEGSGIGLALTKELVELHHGEISVSSQEEEGTEFDIILPLGKDHLNVNEIIESTDLNREKSNLSGNISDLQSEIPSEFRVDSESPSAEKCVLLIVEDNDDMRKYIADHFIEEFEVIEAAEGESGYNKAIEHLPDCIVSDVMMPGMDGFQMLEKIKTTELTNHVPVILLTAKASDEAKIEGLQIGADAYMSKPFNTTELEIRVKKLIESRNSLRDKFKKEFLLEPADIESLSLDDDFIKKVHDNIEQNMANPEFNVESLLKEFALGQRQFTRKVVALTGQTPVQFIRIMRLKRALQRIKQKNGTVSQIAFDVGFSNLSYFSKCFQQQFGKLPSEIS